MLLILMFLCHFMEDHTVQGKTRPFILRCVSLLLLIFSVFREWLTLLAVLNVSLQGPTEQKLTVGMGLLCTEVQRCHLDPFLIGSLHCSAKAQRTDRMFLVFYCYYAAWMKSRIVRELSQSRLPNECSKFVGNLAQIFISPGWMKERWWWRTPRLQLTFLETNKWSFYWL